jgi:hypothetical protein
MLAEAAVLVYHIAGSMSLPWMHKAMREDPLTFIASNRDVQRSVRRQIFANATCV